MKLDKYDKTSEFSYAIGGFPTFELLQNHPKETVKILISDKAIENDELQKIKNLALKLNIPIEYNTKLIEKISGKGNVYIIGVFKKYSTPLTNSNHVLLVNPSDMGNLGTIIRVMLGFGYKDLCLITPCVDHFDPKVIRASMGAIFKINVCKFDSIECYTKTYKHAIYPFMLKATSTLQSISNIHSPHTLIFGNESCGLDDSYLKIGTPILIEHSKEIDSLNLSMSVGLALYEFNKQTNK